MPHDPHQPLRDDVRTLGEILGRVLRHHEGDDLFNEVERVREAAKRARTELGASGAIGATSALRATGAMGGPGLSRRSSSGIDRAEADAADLSAVALSEVGANADLLLREMPIASALTVARAFAHFLTLANIAEQHHRVHRRRDHARDPHGQPQRGSCAETFRRLRNAGVSSESLSDAIRSMRVELVFTAHPTEIVRRTLLQKHNRIAEMLAVRDRSDLTPAERAEVVDNLYREIAAAWQTDEVRRARVTPLDEVRAGLVVFEQSLWEALPQYLRAVDQALQEVSGTPLAHEVTPIRFGSWMGGDRDGNANVTPEVTRQATWLARWQAADLYWKEIVALRNELSLSSSHASEELRALVGPAHEPYRALLAEVRDRLAATRALAEEALDESEPKLTGAVPYLSAAELAQPLELCFRSLIETGNEMIAAGRLTDVLRRVATFGVTLARLDIRQEARRHAEAVDWVAEVAGLGRYSALDERGRQAMLVDQLTRGDVRLDELPISTAPEGVRDVLETFRTAATIHPESLGAYVITMASAPSDVLAVEFLQMAAGTHHPQRVAPLFETARDLERAGSIMADLFALPWYRARIGNQQEVMIGYSDSAKDAGRLSADWALYRAQEEVVAACAHAGVHLTLFHGRGGSIGRGGGPTYLAIQSQPPGSIRGTLRATEQGEMIQAKFGLVDIAIRTLEVYTTATLEAAVSPREAPKPEWRACMDQVAARARATYRSIVYEEPRFIPYFRTATPEPELTQIVIGSRPARRTPGGGVESLRAIPWQFAWTQTRLMLPSWLGIEDALTSRDNDVLREMYTQWPFFASTIDLMEMTLAKADGRIATHYDALAPEALRPLGVALRERLARAIAAVLAVTGHQVLLEANPVLRRSINVRNPYVDPINLVQVELLRRLRESDADASLFDAFVVTVNGIAAGMRNTG